MIRIALADDHPLVLQALGELLDAQPDMCVVARFVDGDAVLADIGAIPCDVLILDLSLPGTTGLSVLRELRVRVPGVQVLIYTMYPESFGAGEAAGAAGWVCKREPPSAVLQAVRDIHRGLAIGAPSDAPSMPHEALTPRQREIFLLLCDGAGPGDLVRRLDLSPSTVSTHLAAIRALLGAETNGEILLYAARAGLLG